MHRPARIAILTLAVMALMAVFAQVAYALPSYSEACSNCHGGPALTVNASQTSNNGTTATYSVSATGANAIAVFNGATKIATINSAAGSFSVPVGKTYAIHAVKGPTTSSGIGTRNVSPAAPAPVDTLAPATTSDAQVAYASSAVVNLTATDNAGGTGVKATYFVLDGGVQTQGTLVTAGGIGTHTLEFWSVDIAGNVETPHKTATFTTGMTTATTVAMGTRSAVIGYGTTRSIEGTLTSLTPLAGMRLVLQSSPDGLTWRNSTATTTTAGGIFSIPVKPVNKTYYRVRFAGDSTYGSSVSPVVVLTPKVYMSVPYVPTTVVRNRAWTAWGYLRPRHTAGTRPVKIQFYRYQSGKWVLRKTVSAAASNYLTYSKYSGRVYLPYAGKWRIRAYAPADSKHAATYTVFRYRTVR